MQTIDLENTPLSAIGTMQYGDFIIRDNERASLFKLGHRVGSKEDGFRELSEGEAPNAVCVWYLVNASWLFIEAFVDEGVLVSRVMAAYELVMTTRKRALMLQAVAKCLVDSTPPAPVEMDRDPVCDGDYDPAILIRLSIAVTGARLNAGDAAPGPDDYYPMLRASGWLTLLSLRYDKSFAHRDAAHQVIEVLAPLLATRDVSYDEVDELYRTQIKAIA